jgi:hypothetical protein
MCSARAEKGVELMQMKKNTKRYNFNKIKDRKMWVDPR